MSYPYEYIWEYPGIYSLSVTYGVYNTFYFSQFISLAVINFLEFGAQRRIILQIIAAVATLGMVLMLVFCRGHYSIDLIGGLMFGHYFWGLADRNSWLIDFLLFKIPFQKRFPYFPTSCWNCKEPINQWTVILRKAVDEESSFKQPLKEVPSEVRSKSVEEDKDYEFSDPNKHRINISQPDLGNNVVNNTLTTANISPPQSAQQDLEYLH